MYNSIFIGLIMKITRSIQKMYKNSLTFRLFKSIERLVKVIYRGSLLYKFNKSSEAVLKNSQIYKVVGIFLKFIDLILDSLKKLVERIAFGSVISKGLGYYSQTLGSGLRLFYETFVLLGFMLILGNLLGYGGFPIYFNVLLMIIGLVGIYLNGLDVIAIKESSAINFFLDLFKEDEGGESWW